MRRLVWAFAGRTHHIVGNLIRGSIINSLPVRWFFMVFFVCWFLFFFPKKQNVQKKQNSVKQFGSKSDMAFCWAWSGSVLCIDHQMALAGEKLIVTGIRISLSFADIVYRSWDALKPTIWPIRLLWQAIVPDNQWSFRETCRHAIILLYDGVSR